MNNAEIPDTITARMIAAARRSDMLIPGDARRRIHGFVESSMCGDGGYRGLASGSDIYYTVFAVQTLLAIDAPLDTKLTSKYLRRFSDGEGLDLVNLACLVRLDALLGRHAAARAAARALVRFGSDDGGYSIEPAAGTGSAYAAFLVVTAYEDARLAVPEAPAIVKALACLRCGDGGYANERGLAVGTTSATAAALIIEKTLTGVASEEALDWLSARAGDDGGFRAGPGAPVGDLLSTATALHALSMCGAELTALRERSLDFVEAHWDGSGGFCGHAGDAVPDCEYTFYGLLALGSLVPPLEGQDAP